MKNIRSCKNEVGIHLYVIYFNFSKENKKKVTEGHTPSSFEDQPVNRDFSKPLAMITLVSLKSHQSFDST